jgi:predicted permease
MAVILVIGALLLIQSLGRLQRVDVGFQPDHLLTASINLPHSRYRTQEEGENFYKSVISAIQALPGVVSVGLTSGVPMGGGYTSMPIVPVDRPATVPERGIQAGWRMADAAYLRTMRIPLGRGRLYEDSERSREDIVLSEGLARQLWPDGSDPIGRQIRLGNGQVFAVAGIVGDVRMINRRDEPPPAMYFKPFFLSDLTLVIRTTGEPRSLGPALRAAVKRIDPAQPLFNVRTMEALVDASEERSRLQTTLLTAFAGLALLLGIIGIAGVVAHSVERRTPELAVRLALGATPAEAMRNVARGGVIASLTGLMAGLLGAWALSRTLNNVLYEVRADDPSTFAGVAFVLFAVAIAACWVPARRALRIDPAMALKRE